MQTTASSFTVRLAESEAELRAAQHLRYQVFVEEMGATVPAEDAAARLERDAFDPYFDHLLLIDPERPRDDDLQGVVGVYRVMRNSAARAGIGFYGQSEYDLTPLLDPGRETLELGRSCVHRDYRGGMAMHLMWSGLGEYVLRNNIEILFGVASFHGTDIAALAEPLSYLHNTHLAPEDLRVAALPEHFVAMDILPPEQIDKLRALRAVPSLIKSYLKLGGFVGQGAVVDHGFNTVDVCVLMDTKRMTAKARDIYSRGLG